MATLTMDRDPKRSAGCPIREYLCGVDIFYGGCFVVLDTTSSGYVLDGDTARADNIFVGIAMEGVDNSGGSAGDKSIRVYNEGEFECTIAATADQTYVGQAAYLSTNHEVTLTPGQYSIYIGQITELVSATKVRVRIQTAALPEAITAGAIVNNGTTQPLRFFAGEGAFTTTATTAAVSAGGLTTIVAALAGHIGDSAAAAAQGQLGFTEDASTGQAEVSGGNVTVNRVDGTVSGAKFNYVLVGY